MKEQELKKIFNKFNKVNALIIGDVMIDAYYMGKVNRISPEAPVPIVSVVKKDFRLGGAANVALNVQNLGANPVLCSITGDDENGKLFAKLMKDNQLKTSGIIKSKQRQTTVKTRIIGNNHQMLRVDEEEDNPLNTAEYKSMEKNIHQLFQNTNFDVVIFEDYDKGCINEKLIQLVVSIAKAKKIPTIVDPKKRNFHLYKEVTLFKPNLKELKDGLKTDINSFDIKEIKKTVDHLILQMNCETVMLTLSENGIMYVNKNKHEHFSAHVRSIADVSGAGDTVVSVAAVSLAVQMNYSFIAELSNIAGGLVCEKIGVVPIDKRQLFAEAIKLLRN